MVIGRSYTFNFVSQAASRILTVVVSMTVFVLVARRLGTESLGQFSYVMAIAGIFSVLAEFGTTPLLARDLNQTTEDRGRYWGTFLLVRTCLALAVLLPMGIFALFSADPYRAYLVIILFSLFFISAKFFDPLFQLYDRAIFSFIPSLAFGVIYLFFAIASLESFASLDLVILSYGISHIAYFVLSYTLSRRLIRPTFNLSLPKLKSVLAVAVPFGVSSIFSIINSRADIFLLSYLKSDYEVGIYNAAYKFLDFAAMTSVMLAGPAIPIFSRLYLTGKEELKARYSHILEVLGILLLPIPFLTPFLSKDLVLWIYGPKFLNSAPVFEILSWVGVLIYFAVIGTALGVAAGIEKQVYWNTALTASVNILLNLILIPRFSYLGSAWATLVCEILLVTICYGFLIRSFGNLFCFSTWVKILAANGLLAASYALFVSMPYRYLVLAFLVALYFASVAKFILRCGFLEYMNPRAPENAGAT